MPADLEFISPDDKPALVAVSHPERLAKARSILTDLDYKVHVATNHEEFLLRFSKVRYHVVVIEELFASASAGENQSLAQLQRMPMAHRRNAVIFLLGDRFQTLHEFQAFQASVHAVINSSDADRLRMIIQQVVADQEEVMRVFGDIQMSLR